MNEPPTYRLRWRGTESGPFPLSVLEQQLEEGQVCLWHEVLVQGRWTTIEELTKSTPPVKPGSRSKGSPARGQIHAGPGSIPATRHQGSSAAAPPPPFRLAPPPGESSAVKEPEASYR